ncbi:MAG: gamma-glutamyltransferase family protein [Rhizobiaceae bacterium]|nr:gamma-glutamyltransferase family protein [Rhizobiaceae bacterium]
MRRFVLIVTIVLIIVAPVFASAPSNAQTRPPPLVGKTLVAKSWMVSTASAYASRAGREIIKSGGNAIDAMVAIQLVLGLVEPNASGLGGGSFMVYWDAENSRLTTYDGRETAPALAGENLFTKSDGENDQFHNDIVGARSVAIPGTLKLLEKTHAKHGSLPWENLFQPAIRLARSGFKITSLLNNRIAQSSPFIYSNEATRAYFLSEEAVPLFPDTIVMNKVYADTLEKISLKGSSVFYNGQITQNMVASINSAFASPRLLSVKDFTNYDVIERPPLCINYRGYDICGLGGPASATITLAQILELVEPHDLARYGPNNPLSWRIIAEASKLAFADRSRFMADIESEHMTSQLLKAEYLAERRKLVRVEGALLSGENIKPGIINDLGDNDAVEFPSGSHFSIVDNQGNVVSMTSSLGNDFGSILMVEGFLLNNAMTDFSTRPRRGDKQVLNSVAGGKRPLSSMSPTIVLKEGKPIAALGSTGDTSTIVDIARTIIALVDWKMEIQQAIELPDLIFREGVYLLEQGSGAEQLEPALRAYGYETISGKHKDSGQHAITFSSKGISGAADLRRDGIVLGGN